MRAKRFGWTGANLWPVRHATGGQLEDQKMPALGYEQSVLSGQLQTKLPLRSHLLRVQRFLFGIPVDGDLMWFEEAVCR